MSKKKKNRAPKNDFSHHVIYKFDEKKQYAVHFPILPRLAEALNSDKEFNRSDAQKFLTKHAWKKLVKKYGELRRHQEPTFNDLVVMPTTQYQELLEQHGKKVWRYQGAGSQKTA